MKIFTRVTALLFAFSMFCVQANAQCTISILGDTCFNVLQEAQTSSNNAIDTLTWYKEGAPVQVRINKGYSATGTYVAGTGSNTSFNTGLYVDRNGFIYIADQSGCKVTKWKAGDSSGVVVAGYDGCGSGSRQMGQPLSVTVDKDDNVYVGELYNQRVSKWAPGGADRVIVAYADAPTGLCTDADNNLYVADNENNEVKKWAPGSGTGVVVAGGHGGGGALNQLNGPEGICIDADNNLYIADMYNYRVVRWSPGNSKGVVVAGGNGGEYAANTVFPSDVCVDAQGNLFIADAFDRVVWWPRRSSYGITVAGGHGGFNEINYSSNASKIALDKERNLYVLGFYVTRFTPVNKIDRTYMPPPSPYYYPGNYSAKAVFSGGCTATSNAKNLVTPPLQNASITSSNAALCGIDTFGYTVQQTEGANAYTWVVPQGTTIISGQGTQHIELQLSGSFRKGDLIANPTNACGSSVGFPLTISRLPADPFRITGKKNITAGTQHVSYSVFTPQDNTVYTWTVPDGATIASGQGTASIRVNWGSTPGYVSVTVSNDCGTPKNNSASYYVNVTPSFAAQTATVAGALKTGSTLRLYPQPVTNTAIIEFTAPASFKAMVVVTDMQGRTIMRQPYTALVGANKLQLSVSHLKAGEYFVSIVNNVMQLNNTRLIKN